ncbi:MAG: histidinol-phosphate transaminase [Candidatus Wildermuthbacteria bacterium RIFCSPHIGHO2_02_FULL_49_9]|uniref:Histidinol-phosphate aminotransferase n=1 Tax=Candidatus Wildermuthbacteria bacterium RIFCSPHIGHO2_02_FULL_49_9 TaxID=1802456 RepID=A0A1G2RCF0_9BACT|nr:MAG: histidinol-phosphate transaminase [Candidatus Wildermuthbacteria bacterium RIFCSPHIGHO2_02_FULL_49_9]
MKKKKFLAELEEYIPGKSIEEVADEFRINPRKIIKLASNENPFGPSPKVKKVILENLDKVPLFPDPLSIQELKETISETIGISVRSIVLGAGSDGVFDTLSKILIDKGDNTIIPTPTFSMYEFVTRVAGGNPIFVQRDRNFNISTAKLLSSVNKRTKLIFLCSPNNPSGGLVPKEDIEKILRRVTCYVLADEAYIEYAEPGSSAVNLFKKHRNLIITRTFSKVYGLANLRVGYGILPENLVKDFEKTNMPFFTSSLGIKAARVALEDKEYARNIIRLNAQGRDYITRSIKFRVYPSQSNFVLVDVSPLKAKNVVPELQKKGIILRDASSFGPYMDSYIRVSVGTMAQNKKMVHALNKFFPK